MKLYSVYDSIAETWSPPFLQENDRSAWRSFEQLLAKNPSVANDVFLHCLADWHPTEVDPLPWVEEKPRRVNAASVMKELENAQS